MIDATFDKINRFVPEKWQWVLNHGGFRKYFKNTGWMFFGQMFSLLVSFFIGAWLVRYLGPENYGVISYVLAFSGIFSFIANLGIDGILNRELVVYPEKRDELMGTAFRLKLIGGFLSFFLTVVIAFVYESSWLTRGLISLYSLAFVIQAINIISIFFQAQVLSKNNVRAVLMATIISSVLKIILILLGKGIVWLTLIYLIDTALQGFGYILSYRRYKLKIINWRYNKELAKKIISNSWFLMLSSASIYIYTRIGQVIIRQILDERAVGLYSAATKLSEIWYFIPGIICASLFPAIINSKKTNQDLYYSRLKRMYVLIFTLSLMIAMAVSVLAKTIVNFLFGADYLESVLTLRIYAWSTIGLFLGMVSGYYLLAENYIKIYFFSTFFVATLNVLLNILLIPRLGINGAAIATVISYSFLFLALWFFKKTRKETNIILNY